MKKPVKIAGIIGATLLLILAGVAILAKVLITPERVKNTVLPIAEKTLHRPVQLGEIEVSIFSGIILKQLAILEKDAGEAFVKADQLQLRYQFWPLLSGRVVVDEIRLDRPAIRVVRLPDGSFNYSDIVAKKERPSKPEPKQAINLLVSKVVVTNGTLRFEDRSGSPAEASVYTITGIDISSRDISPDHAFPFTIKGNVAGLLLTMDGKASDVAAKPTIDALISITAEDLRKTAAALPPKLTAKMRPLDPSGGVTVRLHVAGPVAAPKELLKEGDVKLKDVQVAVSGQRPALAGDIALKGNALESKNLTLSAGPNTLKIAFSAANIFARPITISSAISADRFDLDPFLKKPPASGSNSSSDEAKPEPGPMNIPVRASGSVQLNRTAYKGLPVTGLFAKYSLAGNVATIEELKGNVAGGSFNSTARVDLNRPGYAYTSRLAVQAVQAEQVVAAFAPKATGTVYGSLSAKANLEGKGVTPPSIKKNLNGQGDFTISNGRLTGAGLVQGLAQFINLEQLRVLQFSTFAGTFQIRNGKIVVDSSVAGKDVQMTPKGTIGLDRSLDLSLVTRLSPELTGKIARGDIATALTDEKGWSLLPVKVGGTTSSPRFRLDASMAGEQLKSKAKGKLQQTIQEKLLKKKPGEPQRPEEELLDKGLKGIFGK